MNQVPVVVHDDDDDNIIGEDNNVGIMKANNSIPVDTQTRIQSQACITHMHERKVFLSNISSPYYINVFMSSPYYCKRLSPKHFSKNKIK